MSLKIGNTILKTSPADLQDRRMWGRAIRSYKGAIGDGVFEQEEPNADGSLDAMIPLLGPGQVRMIWDAGGLGKDDPKSGWNTMHKYDHFKLGLRSFKFRRHLFSKFRWLTGFGFSFECADDFYMDKAVQIGNIGFSSTESIADIFLLVDKLMLGEWPLVTNPHELLQT